ncbi:unnamed protein product [Pseudo-nitzschia multistriata]|uniref:Uncharacterized protein n=1 Tax=Pseudo-nitzschia multistriata TaxID=183589 RepID=A0A448ZEN7_9STRA|nr:unnamed protein product [Pseudo-nitzschia multistriata]
MGHVVHGDDLRIDAQEAQSLVECQRIVQQGIPRTGEEQRWWKPPQDFVGGVTRRCKRMPPLAFGRNIGVRDCGQQGTREHRVLCPGASRTRHFRGKVECGTRKHDGVRHSLGTVPPAIQRRRLVEVAAPAFGLDVAHCQFHTERRREIPAHAFPRDDNRIGIEPQARSGVSCSKQFVDCKNLVQLDGELVLRQQRVLNRKLSELDRNGTDENFLTAMGLPRDK